MKDILLKAIFLSEAIMPVNEMVQIETAFVVAALLSQEVLAVPKVE